MAADDPELRVLSDELSRMANIAAYSSSTEIALVAAQIGVHATIITLLAGQPPNVSWEFWFVLPLVPYWVTGFHMMHGARGTIQGFYVRALERRMHFLSGARVDLDKETSLAAPAYFHLVHTTSSSRSAFPEQRLLYVAGILVMNVLMLAESFYCIQRIDGAGRQLAATLIYLGLAVLIFSYTLRITIWGPDLWSWTLRALSSGWARGLGPESLASVSRALTPPNPPALSATLPSLRVSQYRLHPRPLVESARKSLLGLVIMALALLRPPFELLGISRFVLAALYFLVFEFIVYPARYYINDKLDRSDDVDGQAPARPRVGRDIPVAQIYRIAGGRVAVGTVLMMVVAHWAGFSGGAWLTCGIVACFALSVALYELARAWFPVCDDLSLAAWGKFGFYLFALWTGYALRAFVALVAGFNGSANELGEVTFASGAGLLGCAAVILHLSDVALIYDTLQPTALRRRRQGHLELLRAVDRRTPGLRPGVARFRESRIPCDTITYWLFLFTTPLLVVGFAMILGESSLLRCVGLMGGTMLMQGAYLYLRRSPTALWVPLVAGLTSLLMWSISEDWSYWQCVWVAAPVVATHAYFELFRDTPPMKVAGFQVVG